jgi:hypothetical protein
VPNWRTEEFVIATRQVGMRHAGTRAGALVGHRGRSVTCRTRGGSAARDPLAPQAGTLQIWRPDRELEPARAGSYSSDRTSSAGVDARGGLNGQVPGPFITPMPAPFTFFGLGISKMIVGFVAEPPELFEGLAT